jgi:hypothetical protein
VLQDRLGRDLAGLIPIARRQTGFGEVAQNLHRRHLTESRRSMIGGRLAKIRHGGDRRSEGIKSPLGDLIGREKAAGLVNVSPNSITRVRGVLERGACASRCWRRSASRGSTARRRSGARLRAKAGEKLSVSRTVAPRPPRKNSALTAAGSPSGATWPRPARRAEGLAARARGQYNSAVSLASGDQPRDPDRPLHHLRQMKEAIVQ